MIRLLLPLVMLAAAPAQGQGRAEDALHRADRLTRLPGCERGSAEIVVCADRDAASPHRLPLPVERAERDSLPTLDSHLALAGAPIGTRAECGIFANQQRCSKADMRASGWGGGRDPLTAIVRGVTAVVDPDAARGEPAPRPR